MPDTPPPQAPRPVTDVAAWVAVGIATVATCGYAATLVGVIAPSELPIIIGSTVVLAGGASFAAWRHLRAVRLANEARAEMVTARSDEIAARDRLSLARHAAALMASMPQEQGIRAVLTDSLARFEAHAGAVVGESDILVTTEGTDEVEARTAAQQLAQDTIKAGRSITVANGQGYTAALTAPLRIRGELRDVMVLWRHGHAFRGDDLDGLSLVARIVELSMENTALVDDVRVQLGGTLHAMVDLVEQRMPNYIPHSSKVAIYAMALGRAMGLGEEGAEQLRLAAMLHDVGMLEVPETILNAPRRLTPEELVELHGHPYHGAELTRVANFGPVVQEAILAHHERVDGTGYPKGLRGDAIPIAARILSVCDAYVAMISDRPQRPRMSPTAAMAELRAGVGRAWDGAVVDAFAMVQAHLSVPE